MLNVIIQSAILLFVVGLNYGCVKLAKKTPDIISGFKMSEEPEQRERDKVWLNLLLKYVNIANTVMLFGGIVGIVSGLHIVYYVFLAFPIVLALLVAYSRRHIGETGKGKNVVVVITLLVVTVLICIPIFYSSQSDLHITFKNNRMEISGPYGLDIPLYDIREIRLCKTLPEISIRTNGFSLDKTNIGYFRSVNGKSVMLFTHSNQCILYIEEKDGMGYYLSYKDEKATRKLFLELQKRIISSK
jgi:hypothetical protein